ncbi:MAG: GNAT family N-acetyltransferase [Odoribacteraceae bacterium]|jgi:diamine N-acetyltransferase|nr:GNAT family N-acetyltransferase [Odoribacteraceae bacterium]
MIKDETIQLRSLEPEDLEYLYKWENNMDLWEVSDTLAPFSRFTLKKYIENSHLDIYTTKQLRLIIELIETKRPVGLVDLYDFDPYHQRAGLGIMIHSSEDRKMGYASSAILLMLSYGFETLGLNQVYCSVPSCNIASLNLFEKLGFIRTGYRKEWLRRGREWEDVVYFQILSRDSR